MDQPALLLPGPGEEAKRRKLGQGQPDRCRRGTMSPGPFAVDTLDDNLLYEVLSHVDARTLATAACVSKRWRATAYDESLWEMICTRHWANVGCATRQLRSVVLALGGFRRLHALCLRPLSRSQSSPSLALSPPSFPPAGTHPYLGKDEVHLSLSLLSIRYYETMNYMGRDGSN